MIPPRYPALLLTLLSLGAAPVFGDDTPSATATPLSLTGTWTLVAADKQLPDGSRVSDYGAHPHGRLIVDNHGRYVMHIGRAERMNFKSGNRADGTPEEYRGAVMGLSTHYGVVAVDEVAHTLTFTVEDASFPNLRGAVQKRQYEYRDGVLSYRVAARPDGSVPISVWKRLD